jgi:hypothetical protein
MQRVWAGRHKIFHSVLLQEQAALGDVQLQQIYLCWFHKLSLCNNGVAWIQRQLSWVVSWLGLQASPSLVKSTILRTAVSWLTLADAIWGDGVFVGLFIQAIFSAWAFAESWEDKLGLLLCMINLGGDCICRYCKVASIWAFCFLIVWFFHVPSLTGFLCMPGCSVFSWELSGCCLWKHKRNKTPTYLNNGLLQILGGFLCTYLCPWSGADGVSVELKAPHSLPVTKGNGLTLREQHS